jgi:hypothetical protein
MFRVPVVVSAPDVGVLLGQTQRKGGLKGKAVEA